MICFVFIPGKCTTAFPVIRTALAVGCATRKSALSRQTRPDCRGFSGILNVADGKPQNPQLIRGPAGGVRVASRRPCQQRIIPVFDRNRMTRMSTAHGIRKTRCCIGRSRPIWKRFSLASRNAAVSAGQKWSQSRRFAGARSCSGFLIAEFCQTPRMASGTMASSVV